MRKKSFIQICLLSSLFAGSLFSQESLFLRTTGKCQTVEEDGTQRRFQIGAGETEEDYEEGEAVPVANPTYDLTFKLLFTPVDPQLGFRDLGDESRSNKRLMSLLNSIIYPDATNNPNSERIVKVELEPTELLTQSHSKNEELDRALTALRCDIVCKCTIQKQNRQNQQTFFIYFDIEMQRAKLKKRIDNFFGYRNFLEQKYKTKDVRLIAFLNYATDSVVQDTVSGDFCFDREKEAFVPIGESVDEAKKRTSPVIGLRTVVAAIQEGKEVVIMPDKPLKSEGKEWMKLLGVQWWASLAGNHRYVVPMQVQCPGVKESLQILNHKGITDAALQAEYSKIFDANKLLEASKEEGWEEGEAAGRKEGRKEGEQIGQLKGLMQGFIAGQFFDFLANGLDSQFLSEDFVRNIWNTLPPSANRTEKKLEDFLQALRERDLLI
ncbi:MAG: hypothetical protein LBF34_01080 [Puniceicoccales bacterium]|jgi:hypothetical protein|nr:hypothetical protein [Puniceicoccales bacterium]